MKEFIKPIDDLTPKDIIEIREQANKTSIIALNLLAIHYHVPIRVERALERAYREGHITKPVNKLSDDELANIRQIGPKALIAIREALENYTKESKMIGLHLNKTREFKVGEVIHLKVVSIYENAPGKWRLTVDDVTPLPGAEPTGYGCHICGIIEEAKPDGSLPEDWTQKKFEDGTCFVCSKSDCQEEPICRVCGCTNEHACEEGCSWVEPDLCSACAGKTGQ